MLDLDPAAAAHAHSDQHAKSSLFAYAQTLAYAWHSLHNEQYAPWEDEETLAPTPWFTREPVHCDPYSKSAERPRAKFPGESPWSRVLLFGQQVPARRCDAANPSELWVEQTGGNYTWLWRCAAELATEYHCRFGRRHPAEPAIWTLEVVPFALRDSLEDWSETPVDTLPNHLRVVADGYYDTVATNRRFYNTHQQSFSWTDAKTPVWLAYEEAPTPE